MYNFNSWGQLNRSLPRRCWQVELVVRIDGQGFSSQDWCLIPKVPKSSRTSLDENNYRVCFGLVDGRNYTL